MKKLLVAMVIVPLLISCGETYYHNMSFAYPAQGQMSVLYADQTGDSAVFTTTDNFYCTPINTTWMTVHPDYVTGKIQYAYQYAYYVSVPLTFEVNTTGNIRYGYLQVRTQGEDGWDHTSQACYMQLPWLNITKPAPTYVYDNRTLKSCYFEMTDSATQASDTLKFQVNGDWTLSSESSILKISKTSGSAGSNVVPIAVEQNASEEERKDSIVLTSRGVSTTIRFTQKGISKK